VSDTDLKFGNVIRFDYAGDTITALVIATKGGSVRTDEGTDALGGSDQIVVFGLANNHASDPRNDQYHQEGETAAFSPTIKRYEVLE